MAIKKKKVDYSKQNFKPLNLLELNEVNILDDKNIIGCDETGVGDYLTPIVAAAVFVEKNQIDELIKLGIKDSKTLSDSKIKELFLLIKDKIKFRVNHLTQKGYNNLNKYLNAHEIKMFLHLKSITQLEIMDKVEEDFIFLDQFASLENINKYYENLMLSKSLKIDEINQPVYLSEKAETKHVAVACASIVARNHFLKMMEEQESECNMKFPLGTNEAVEKAAIDFCNKFGRKALYEIAKISFKTTKKIDEVLEANKTEK